MQEVTETLQYKLFVAATTFSKHFPKEWANLLFYKIFAENCMKMK